MLCDTFGIKIALMFVKMNNLKGEQDMRDDTKRWIEEIASSVYHLLIHEPWLSWKSIQDEVQGYYDCTSNEFKTAAKIAEKQYDKPIIALLKNSYL